MTQYTTKYSDEEFGRLLVLFLRRVRVQRCDLSIHCGSEFSPEYAGGPTVSVSIRALQANGAVREIRYGGAEVDAWEEGLLHACSQAENAKPWIP